jgi:putative membrane protein
MTGPKSRSEPRGGTPDKSQPVDDYLPGHLLRGILMGCADSVPGISGGTVALVLGIYQRLVMAISHFDRRFLRLLGRRAWRQAAAHVDLRFLGYLLAGVLTGLLLMTTLAHQLLTKDTTRPFTLATFLGMMLACTWLVARPLRPRNRRQWWTLGGTALLAGLLGWTITTLPTTDLSPTLLYLFFAGMVGICAMILPGISGAMILYIMGVYLYLTGIPADLFAGRQVGPHMVEIAVFFAGCLTGLMIFSRLLRYLLVQFHSITMAFLCGAMVGSMRALWPFQKQDPGSQAIEYQLYLPSQFDRLSLGVILAVAFGVMLVISSRLLAGADKKTPS